MIEKKKKGFFNLFFHFICLNWNLLLNISFSHFKLCMYSENILLEGTMSQILNLGLSFVFI